MNDLASDGPFWVTTCGIILSFLGGIGYYAHKSKCIQCNLCWGLVQIQRDPVAENLNELQELDHGVPQPSLNQP